MKEFIRNHKALTICVAVVLVVVLAVTVALASGGRGGPNPTEPTSGTNSTNPTDPTVQQHVHSYDAQIVAATCTEKGYTKHTCSCGDSKTDTEVAALGHSFGQWTVTKAATEEAEGSETRTCSRCSESETRKIDKLPHTHAHTASTIVQPTCTEKGYTVMLCKCGDSYQTDIKNAPGHTWGAWVVTKEPAIGVCGEKKRSCQNCDAFEREIIPELEEHKHAYKDEVIAPTCIEKGYTLTYDIPHTVRLVRVPDYSFGTYEFLKGFISGMHAGNYDITQIFIDGLTGAVSEPLDGRLEDFLDWCESFSEREGVKFTMAVTIDEGAASEGVRKYM